MQLGQLELDRGRLVARVRAARFDLAQRLVLDELCGGQPQAPQPSALQPAVVDLLMGVGVVLWPADERRPPMVVVRADRLARPQQVPGEVIDLVRTLDRDIVRDPERRRDTERVVVLS